MSPKASGRPLDPVERAVLDFLLSIEVSGRHEGTIQALRIRADTARVADEWECCPSVTFAPSVDGHCGGAPLIESRHRTGMFELLLFASDDGELRCLEIVHYAEGPLAEFPSVDQFEPPFLFSWQET